MIDHDTLKEVMEIGAARRADRRRFIKMASAGIAAAGGLSMMSACGNESPSSPVSPTPSPTATTAASDVDILNFALSLEYLEGNYYSFAAFGQGPNASLLTGTGTQGAVSGGRQVQFSDPTVASYAREIAQDEISHILFLRGQLGTAAVAQPAINIDGTAATGAFAMAAKAAGIASAAGTFDPYASDDNWLLGGMLLTDVGVTAYKGSASLISSGVILDAAAGILATEAYHSGLIRTLLYRRGVTMPTDRSYSEAISNARDSLDGNTDTAATAVPRTYADDDQGVVNPSTVMANGISYPASNLTPTDANGVVFGRTAANVLNEVFLTKSSATSGGFFPAGINGNIKTSNANG